MNLLRALLAVSSLTLVSRILGYVRDFFIARAFGAGLATDAFFVAFRIPNLLRRLFAEGAFSQAFVPVLAEHKNRHPEAETKTLIDGAATALFLALVIAAALGMAAAPLIVYIPARGGCSSSWRRPPSACRSARYRSSSTRSLRPSWCRAASRGSITPIA